MSTPSDVTETMQTTEEPSGGLQNRRTLLLIVAGLVVALAALWFFVLRGGPEVEEAAAPTPAPAEEPETTGEPGDEPPKAGRGPVETFQVFAPRDPFDPLVTAESAPTTDTGDTLDGGSTITNGGGGGTPDGNSDGGQNANVGSHRVQMIDVFRARGGRRAQIEVDGTVYTVDVGEGFGDNFELMSTSGTCATMLFGDDQFTLCEGEEILK